MQFTKLEDTFIQNLMMTMFRNEQSLLEERRFEELKWEGERADRLIAVALLTRAFGYLFGLGMTKEHMRPLVGFCFHKAKEIHERRAKTGERRSR